MKGFQAIFIVSAGEYALSDKKTQFIPYGFQVAARQPAHSSPRAYTK
jgi:hypothetical protein